jgi:hypothetical protein
LLLALDEFLQDDSELFYLPLLVRELRLELAYLLARVNGGRGLRFVGRHRLDGKHADQ